MGLLRQGLRFGSTIRIRRKTVRGISFLFVPCLVLTLVACTQAAKPATQPAATPGVSATVTNATIQNIKHENLTVKVGTTVEWTNKDGVPHTVTEQGRKFKSGFLNQGQTFKFTFQEAGTVNYFCEVHPDAMKATVVVAR